MIALCACEGASAKGIIIYCNVMFISQQLAADLINESVQCYPALTFSVPLSHATSVVKSILHFYTCAQYYYSEESETGADVSFVQ